MIRLLNRHSIVIRRQKKDGWLHTKQGGVSRWILRLSSRTAITSACNTQAGKSKHASSHADLGQHRNTQEEKETTEVKLKVKSLESPFVADVDNQLVHLTSSIIAHNDIETWLLGAYNQDKKAYSNFVKERLFDGTHDFFSNMSMLKSKTFPDLSRLGQKVQ